MAEKNEVGTYKFVAEPFHVDFTGKLTMGVLGNHLLNCAGFHATERGFGIAELNESHYTWVLSRLAIEMEEYPMQYEEFSIQTWVENVYRLFTDRNRICTLYMGNDRFGITQACRFAYFAWRQHRRLYLSEGLSDSKTGKN